MAIMYPPTVEDAHASAAERQLFDLLQRSLCDEFFCYHSKPLLSPSRAGLREGEIDFVILHAALGLLALEVKGGGLARDGAGRWCHVRADGSREPLRKDPFAQARDNLHALVALLQARIAHVLPEWGGRLRLPHGHAVILPDVALDRGAAAPSGMAPELLLDATTLADLEAHVRAAMAVWAGERTAAPARAFKRFRRHVFHPALHLVPTLAGRVLQEGALLRRLTDEQLRLIDATELVVGARVQGPAGTGKTVLAVEKARRLAAAGRRVCLICYNRPLAGAIRGLLEEDTDDAEGADGADGAGGAGGAGVHVSTFHGLCRRAADLLGRPFDVPQDPAQQQAFWRDQAPDFLLEAALEGRLSFDALVVDEAQDLLTEWWAAVEALLPPAAPLWVFYDPDQDIYDRAGAMPAALVPLSLTINCRATRRLRALCDSLTGRATSSPAAAPEGAPHEEVRYTDAADLRRKLEDRVAALLKQGLHPAQLVILAPHRQPNGSLAGVEALGGLPIVSAPDLAPDKGQGQGQPRDGILYSTARRFKGLEADVVLLIDQDLEDPACTPVHRYVAASRARSLLVVFSRGPWR